MFNYLKRLFTKKVSQKPVAILVGHSRLKNGHPEGGARSATGVSEHEYNMGLAHKLQKQLASRGVRSQIIGWYEGNNYAQAMTWLSSEVQRMDAVCAIELHFNASGPGANGHEWLYWHTSDESKALAYSIDVQFVKMLPQLRQRGIKAIRTGERGSMFCRKMHCPSIIAEPFFGTNAEDWSTAQTDKDTIAAAMATGIAKWMK